MSASDSDTQPPSKKAKGTANSTTCNNITKHRQDLREALGNQDAAEVVRILTAHPALAMEKILMEDLYDKGAFPLLLLFKFPPPSLVQVEHVKAVGELMVGGVPSSRALPTMEGEIRSPSFLQFACQECQQGIAPGVLQYLIDKCPLAPRLVEGFHQTLFPPNHSEELPIHKHLRSDMPQLHNIRALVEAYPDCLKEESPKGMGQLCLNLALQNPNCPVPILEYLIQRWTERGGVRCVKIFSLPRRQRPTSLLPLRPTANDQPPTIDEERTSIILEDLLPHVHEEFDCCFEPFLSDAFVLLLTGLANLSNIRLKWLTLNVRNVRVLHERHCNAMIHIIGDNPNIACFRISGRRMQLQCEPFLEALKTNTNLEFLAYDGCFSHPTRIIRRNDNNNDSNNHRQNNDTNIGERREAAELALEAVFQDHNKTLAKLFLTNLRFIRGNVEHLVRMNRFGRAMIHQSDMKPREFVALFLLAVSNEEDPELKNELVRQSILYGLLREVPALWVKHATCR